MVNDHPPTVLVTGASSGIGLEIARRLTAHGCAVWGTSRDPVRLPQLPGFHAVRMNLASLESIRAGFAQALQEAGEFDVLINNAGAGVFGPTATVTTELAHEQFQVLVHGPIELVRLAVPSLQQRPRATIINLSSLAAEMPIPFMGAYNAAKAALSSYSRCLRLELAHTSIRVVAIQPADINTAFHAALERVPAESNESKAQDQSRLEAVWEAQQRHMAAAPPPRCVAERVWRIINSNNPPPVVNVGGGFQAFLAPLAARLMPCRWLDAMLRRYYRL
jgi:NAD(P)-dependent dehydrogenase (short-subunit alcohol dehydrogenase family)